MKETRVNKYLSEVGFCSRRAADKMIDEKRVTINGEVAEMGTKVTEKDVIRVNGKRITGVEKDPVYIAFNKPIGIVCTTDQKREKNNIIDYINYPTRIFPIGRLDKPSEGLILLTDDGDIVNKILRARNNHEKEYIVTVDKPITDEFVKRMSGGVPILDTVTRECVVEKISKYTFRIILTQGLNRQIRRMSEYLGFEVTKLKRIRIMNIPLDVPIGKYRDLTKAELDDLLYLCGDSAKTHDQGEVVAPVMKPRPVVEPKANPQEEKKEEKPRGSRADRRAENKRRKFEANPDFEERPSFKDRRKGRDMHDQRDNGGSGKDPNKRSSIRIGAKVAVVQKHHQRTNELTEGTVSRLLTNSPNHPHGIKVKLQNGIVGRVKRIIE